MTNSSNRNILVDGIKFILICLVILGHISYYDYGLRINRIIYSFHMPLFVIISGIYTHQKSKESFLKSTKKLILLYLIFQIGHIFFSIITTNIVVDLSILIKIIDPAIALWYLLCIIFWRTMYFLLSPNKIDIKILFILSIVLSFISGFIPLGNNFLAFQRTFSFLPFFVFGLMLRSEKERTIIIKIKPIFLIVSALIALIFAFYLPGFMPSSPYKTFHDPFLRLFQSFLALIICIGIIKFLPKRIPAFFCKMGQWTLYYYLYHTFMIRVIPLLLDHYNISLNVFEALIIVALIVILITLMHKIKLFRLLLLEK